MRQQSPHWYWPAIIAFTLLAGLGLGALFHVAVPDSPDSWQGDEATSVPSVSAPPTHPQTRQPDPSKLVKAFAEVDGRLYRIIVAPSPALESTGTLWSAALSDDESPR